ncbi:outer membrane family protein [Helicobacter mustelae]|uniref:Putative secreted protein n=1 Tax=Helicobacter mustelae (strain ATCC 43772 / CCUG 25715 / CIP 103759 / LMG 18044 / NCTC 12198 / R85-136P) TaxID=679897 RepID=D3UI48_HELM1|nr:outer membrane family protein [Helicobacter mustelae]CBG40171.1 Putative secreted protein [Helicobacter mustelae 12198]SQH71673.1 Putative outer membrane protein [Helicobacter mustelae]
MLKISKFFALAGLLYGCIAHADTAEITSARTIEQAFAGGKIGGHVGLFTQQSTSLKDPSYLDINSSFSYDTLRYHGYKVGAEFWLTGKLFDAKPGNFSGVQQIFIFSHLYASFYNQYEKFGIRVGRYAIDEEWMKHNTEGFSIDYDGIENVSLHFSWAFRNAYTTRFYNSVFRRMFRVVGALLFRGSIQIPQFPLSITPYIYVAPGVFFTPGVKATMNLPLPKQIFLKSKAQFLTYTQYKGWYGPNAGTGVLFELNSSVSWMGLEGGVGGMFTSAKGASMIDGFGQHTPFQRPVGMFRGDARTLYAFGRYSLRYLDVYGAMRTTFLDGKNIFNWEFRVSGTPLRNIKGLELGFSILGMNNPTNAEGFFGGSKKYTLFRGYIQYKF